MDKDGAVVGLLDIAKCLYDAISVLERVDTESENNNSSTGNKDAIYFLENSFMFVFCIILTTII
jgi:hypothetical protein